MNKIINFKYGKIVPPTAGSIRKILVATGEYHDYIIEWAKKFGKANSVILDVGANIGCHTIPFAQLFDGSCEVYAFEPEPEAHDILSENIKLNNLTNVRIIKKGLSNETKKQEFFINPHSGGSTLSPNPEHGTDQSNPIDIDTIKLDDLNINNIGFIKVDIQFWEYYFLEGALETLIRNRPPLVLELCSRNQEEKIDAERCFELLKSIKYRETERIGKDVLFMFEGKV